MKSNKCIVCKVNFNPKRAALGYSTCLQHGAEEARLESIRKAKCTAPAYNKGAYQYITSTSMAKDLQRK